VGTHPVISQAVLRAFGRELKKVAAMSPLPPPPKPTFNVAATQAPKASTAAQPVKVPAVATP
jgi:hypothetical protein